MRLNVVTKQFEVLGDAYTSKEACDNEVKIMNEESGCAEYEYDI